MSMFFAEFQKAIQSNQPLDEIIQNGLRLKDDPNQPLETRTGVKVVVNKLSEPQNLAELEAFLAWFRQDPHKRAQEMAAYLERWLVPGLSWFIEWLR